MHELHLNQMKNRGDSNDVARQIPGPSDSLLVTQGVLCGVDCHQEWLLSWWWSAYQQKNRFPVTFCDFGMSDRARRWCQKRGDVIVIDDNRLKVATSDQIPFSIKAKWEALYGDSIWRSRKAWFKKPMALLSTPYDKTLWLDLDCEVLVSVAPLFDLCDSLYPLALMRESETAYLPLLHPDIKYNGGVIVYLRGIDILTKWVDSSIFLNDQFWGDDPLLSYLIAQECYLVKELPAIWNWRIRDGVNLQACIYHWVGSGGKSYIRKWGGIRSALEAFQKANPC